MSLYELIKKIENGEIAVANMTCREMVLLLEVERKEEAREYDKRIDSFQS